VTFHPSPRGYTGQRRTELWARHCAGDSMRAIAADLAKDPGAVDGVIRLQGGITPRLRACPRLARTREEREHISRARAANASRRIARAAASSDGPLPPSAARSGATAAAASSGPSAST
jgi:hypothetical protein